LSRNYKLAHNKVELTVRRNDTSSCSEPPSLSAIPSARFHATGLLYLSHLYALVCAYAYASMSNSRVHSVSKAPLSILERSVMHGLAWSACSCHYTGIFDFVSPTKTMMTTTMMISHSTVVEHRQSPTAGRRAPRPLADVPRARARHL